MIKANELRVGNWINVLNPATNTWNAEPVRGLTIKNMEENPEHHLMVDNLRPIPLTPEVLEKCGFSVCTCGGYKISTLIKGERFKAHMDGANCYEGVKIEYLHQLQNMYFAHTGEELKYSI